MYRKKADYTYHPPSGSNYPGKEEANPYIFYPAFELRRLIETEKDSEELKKMKSALKQWERIYRYPGYPFVVSSNIRKVANYLLRLSEYTHPSINLNYYQDSEVPQGFESVLEGLKGLYNNYDMRKFDYSRQGERPLQDVLKGDFLSPSEPPIGDTVKERGEGPNPDVEYPFPPTGGTIDKI